MPIRILLMDDSSYFLDVASDYLRMSESFEVVGMVMEAQYALEQTRQLQPDVILLDWNLGSQSGVKLIPQFKQSQPNVKIIVLTVMNEAGYAAAALQAGADGFIPKVRMTELLVDTIHGLAAGVQPMDVSEKFQAEYRHVDNIFMRLAEHSTDLIYRYEFIPRRGFTYVSPAATQMTGYSPEEHYADPDLAFKLIHPEDRPILEAVAQGKHEAEQSIVLRWVCKNGKVIWTEQRNINIFNEGGELIAIEGIARDVTRQKETEMALRESQIRFEAIFHDNPAPIAITRLDDNRLVDVNVAWEKVSGYARAEVIGRTALDVNFWADPTQREAMIKDLRAYGKASADVQIRCKSGEIRELLMEADFLHWEGETFLITMAQDITERKQAEQNLRETEERLEMVMQGSQLGYWDWNIETGEVHRNARWAEMLGYTLEEIQFTVRQWTDLHYPDDREAAWKSIQDHLDGKTSAHRSEYRMRTKDGQYKWILDQARIVKRDAQGKPLRMSGTHTDITVHKQVEEQLRKSHEELELHVKERTAQVQDLYDNAPVGYHSLDGQGNLSAVNQTELNWLGYTREELIGKHVTLILAPEDASRFAESFPRFKNTGKASDLGFTFMRKDGTAFPGLVNATAIYDASGNYISSRSTLMDMTERKKAEEALQFANAELERAMRMKDEFLASMSHELRTPLTGILGLTESLQADTYGEITERQKRPVGLIQESGRHLLELINDILDLAKVEAGKLEPHFELISAGEVCLSSLSFFKQLAFKKRIDLSLQCEPPAFQMVADPLRLKQILVNLLSNAVKFTPEGGNITLKASTDRQSQMIFFTVQDNGIGIAPEDVARLFKPFSQLDSSLSRQHAGTGLGLALVKRMAELHNGTVSVTSEVGHGSRFTVAIPWREALNELEAHNAMLAKEMLVASSAPKVPRSRRILLAEDNLANAEIMQSYLVTLGYEVLLAHHGREVLSLAQQHHPDLILMDIQMPIMDGLEAIRRIRSLSEFKDVPIIAVTALAMSGDRERCLAAGANDYATKPYNLSTLVNKIRQMLA